MKIAITCPIFVTNEEHVKYLNLFTRSIVSRDHDIVFIPVENFVGQQFFPFAYTFEHEPLEVSVCKPQGAQSVAKGWNVGIKRAQEMGCDYVLVTNTDIILKSNAIDRLVSFAQSHDDFVMWTASEWADWSSLEECDEDENFGEHPHFSCFMVKSSFLDSEIGSFDENFVPAYCEDGDMHARIALANKKAVIYGGSKFYHFGSRTIKSDRALWDSNTHSYPKNQQYFLDKWGYPIVNDVEKMREVYFKHPYNEVDKDLDYWRH